MRKKPRTSDIIWSLRQCANTSCCRNCILDERKSSDCCQQLMRIAANELEKFDLWKKGRKLDD